MSIKQEIIYFGITMGLKKLYKNKQNKHKTYEYLNCLERWILSFAMTDSKSIGSDTRVYYKINKNSFINKKLAEELSNKKLPHLVEKMLLTVNKGLVKKFDVVKNNTREYIDKKNNKQGWIVDIRISGKEDNVYINIPMSEQRYNTLKANQQIHPVNLEQITIMLLRYSSLLNKGQHWALPYSQFKHLVENYGINYEGFASPLNSGLFVLGGGAFCSLFKDIDAAFGSIGSFFEQTLYHNDMKSIDDLSEKFNCIELAKDFIKKPKHWVINPPFVESVIIEVSDKILKDLNMALEMGEEIMVVYILPSWFDSDGYINIQKSMFLKHTQFMKKKKHYYEHLGERIVVNSRSTVFVLDTYTVAKDYSDIAGPMILDDVLGKI
jgi:hypothetical protein